jgi:hypothetical protein
MNINTQELLTKNVDEILSKAMEFNEKYRELIKKGRRKEDIVGTTQFSNILRNMRFVSCVNEFKLFLKYQEAKNKKHKVKWAMEFESKSLADYLIQYVDEVCTVANNELKNLNSEINSKEKERFKIKCIEKFLSYCYWHVYTLDKGIA